MKETGRPPIDYESPSAPHSPPRTWSIVYLLVAILTVPAILVAGAILYARLMRDF